MAMYSAYRFQTVELIPTKIIRMPMTPKLLDANFPGVEVFGIDQRGLDLLRDFLNREMVGIGKVLMPKHLVISRIAIEVVKTDSFCHCFFV